MRPKPKHFFEESADAFFQNVTNVKICKMFLRPFCRKAVSSKPVLWSLEFWLKISKRLTKSSSSLKSLSPCFELYHPTQDGAADPAGVAGTTVEAAVQMSQQ